MARYKYKGFDGRKMKFLLLPVKQVLAESFMF